LICKGVIDLEARAGPGIVIAGLWLEHQEKSSFGNLGEIWNLFRNLAILVGLGESGENWGKKVKIPRNPEKFGATVHVSQEKLKSDMTVVVDACI
jgi:hypothetical protein